MACRYYPAIIERWASGFGVTFPDFPGCTGYGETVQEAALKAEETLAAQVAALDREKEPIPEPTALDEISFDADIHEVARILVRTELTRRVMRLNITLEEGVLARVDRAAKGLGMSRSGFLAEAARRMILEV